MSTDGPYRGSAGDACPACATVMTSADAAAKVCPRGCGEWVAAPQVAVLWGTAVDIDGDARLKWRTARLNLACAICSQPMNWVLHPGWSSYRCVDHGVWFVKDARGRFEREQAETIALHRALRDELEQMMALIRDAVEGGAPAVSALAMRLLRLERNVQTLNKVCGLTPDGVVE